MSRDARALLTVKRLMTSDHTAFQVFYALGRVRPELVGLLRTTALSLDAVRGLWFVVHAAGWLHSTAAAVIVTQGDTVL